MKKFLKKISSLDRIHQWEERDSVIRESVSQHSFKVSAIAIYILNEISNSDKQCKDKNKFAIFKYRCVSYAVLHDFDEAIIGRDISHKVKYNNYNGDEIRRVLNEFVVHSLSKDFSFVTELDAGVKCFVKLCDWIALSTFIERNRDMGVKTFEDEYVYCKEGIILKSKEVTDMLKRGFGISYNFNIQELYGEN